MNKQAYEHMVGLALDKQAGLGNVILRGVKSLSRAGKGTGAWLQDLSTKPGGLFSGKGSKTLYTIGRNLQSGADRMRSAVQKSRNSGLLKSFEDGSFTKGLNQLGQDIYDYGKRGILSRVPKRYTGGAPLPGTDVSGSMFGIYGDLLKRKGSNALSTAMHNRYGYAGDVANHLYNNRGKYISGATTIPMALSWFGSDDDK